MSKVLLKLEDDYDFYLLGISCHSKDYRLCYEINKTLDIDLVKDEDLIINKNNENANFSLACFDDEENHLEYNLISNKGELGHLIPECKHVNYFMLIRGAVHENNCEQIGEKIKTMDLVLAAFEIRASELKSKANLLF